MRQTSLNTYYKIKSTGLLSKIRLKVTEGFVVCEPCTSTELEKYMNTNHNLKGSWKVLSWLRDCGVIYESGKRDCKITGRNVIEWSLTGNMPVIVKTPPKPKNIDKVIDYILLGMKIRGWESISKETLIKLQSDKHVAKKKTV